MHPSTNKKLVKAWTMYDWANSAYNLVITTTIFPAYYVGITASKVEGQPDYVNFFGVRFINTALQNYTLSVVFLIVALSSPILSSIADYRRNKKIYLRWFSYLGAASCAVLFFFTPTRIELGMIAFGLAALGYWSSLVFYNSYLPDIAAPADQDKVSARGFAMGYIGSVILQIICFVIILKPALFGLGGSENLLPVRMSFLLTGLWWFGFAQITLRAMPVATRQQRKLKKHVLVNGFYELKKVWEQLKNMPALRRFLGAFFFYSMGVQTVMLAAAGFAKKEIFPEQEDEPKLLITMIVIQLVAVLGALGMSRLSKRIGNWWVLAIAVCVWIGAAVSGYYVNSQLQFYFLAVIVGLVMGGIQSMSRSTYSKLLPPTEDTTSFFSFYDVTEKIALIIGLFSFGYVEEITKSMRMSVIAVTVFFIAGLLMLIYFKPAYDNQAKQKAALV